MDVPFPLNRIFNELYKVVFVGSIESNDLYHKYTKSVLFILKIGFMRLKVKREVDV